MSTRQERDGLGYLLALCAATCYGIAAPLLRRGLNEYGSVLTGITIAMFCGWLAILPLALGSWRSQGPSWRPDRRSTLFVVASGGTALLGFSANTYALSLLPVAVVAPISSAYPLVTVVLARIFLHQSETMTRRIVIGAALIVVGVITVAVAPR